MNPRAPSCVTGAGAADSGNAARVLKPACVPVINTPLACHKVLPQEAGMMGRYDCMPMSMET